MRFVLHRLVEGPEILELGERVGSLQVAPPAVEVEDDHLRERLLQLVTEPLEVQRPLPHTQATALVSLTPEDPGYAEALRSRLERRDFRLVLSEG